MVGTLPPTVNDSQGNPRGFWSITVYQPDATQSAAPFISQASVLNTAYSTANIPVTAVDPSTDTITVKPSAWGPLVASTPDPVRLDRRAVRPHARRPVLRRDHPDAQRSTRRPRARRTRSRSRPSGCRTLSARQRADPVSAARRVRSSQLTNPGGPVNLQWGPIQPVSQLGSQQLTSGKLARNPDGSVTIWLAPTLPARGPRDQLDPDTIDGVLREPLPRLRAPSCSSLHAPRIQPIMRIYYPAPGSNTQASILPPPNGSMGATYVFPALQQVG